MHELPQFFAQKNFVSPSITRASVIAEYLRGKEFYDRYNGNQILTVPEYAEKWLDNYVKTKEINYDGF